MWNGLGNILYSTQWTAASAFFRLRFRVIGGLYACSGAESARAASRSQQIFIRKKWNSVGFEGLFLACEAPNRTNWQNPKICIFIVAIKIGSAKIQFFIVAIKIWSSRFIFYRGDKKPIPNISNFYRHDKKLNFHIFDFYRGDKNQHPYQSTFFIPSCIQHSLVTRFLWYFPKIYIVIQLTLLRSDGLSVPQTAWILITNCKRRMGPPVTTKLSLQATEGCDTSLRGFGTMFKTSSKLQCKVAIILL